jgi:hypothetical protein
MVIVVHAESEEELRAIHVQLDNCLKLLVSPPDDFCPTVADDEGTAPLISSNTSQQLQSDSVTSDDAIRPLGGTVRPHSSVNIFLPKEITIREMSDNADLLQTYTELTAVVRRRLSSAQKWLDVSCGFWLC